MNKFDIFYLRNSFIYSKLKESQENLARSIYNIGLAYSRLGDLDNGIRYARDAYEMRQRLCEDKPNVNLAQSLSNMGLLTFYLIFK